MLHWKTFIFIHYIITSQWPIMKHITHIEVHISGKICKIGADL